MIQNQSTGDSLCSQWFANLDDTRSQLLECPCCLWRLLNLYDWFNDSRRARICHQPWADLQRNGHSLLPKVH
jgi:hypothetical protein